MMELGQSYSDPRQSLQRKVTDEIRTTARLKRDPADARRRRIRYD
jgi:hypothetical protein